MIKYIGQHIFDFIARFRSDVYLEDIADGTVASDKFLGLDDNNKIVKETVSAGVTISDSTANTNFPVVFHDESNNLHDDTGAFTYNPSTGNLVVGGDLTVSGGDIYGQTDSDLRLRSDDDIALMLDSDNDGTSAVKIVNGASSNVVTISEAGSMYVADTIELGHVNDTTLARSAAGRVTIEGNTIITAGNEVVSAGNHILKQTKVTIDTSGFNGLNSTPVELVAAQGANTMIVPTEVVVFADRAATNTNSTDLIVAYNGGTSFATAVKYIRRFMQNVTTDRTTIMGPYVGTASNDLTTPINSKLTIALGAAPTTNCMTSLTVYTSYYVIDIS